MKSSRGALYALVLGAVCLIPAACSQPETVDKPSDLDRLAGWMTGSFSSEQQSIADSAFFDIRLHMAPIWTDRTDGHWLYVEQAAASTLDQPYRQRVYHVTQVDDTTFRSAVFAFDEPLRFAGAWQEAHPLSALTPDSLEVRTGCAIVLHREGDSAFVGSTIDRECESSLRGATFATSEVRITAGAVESWDRGFDAEGSQVWGAEKAGYIFDRLTDQH